MDTKKDFEETKAKKEGPGFVGCILDGGYNATVSRESARRVIERIIEDRNKELLAYETMLKAIPWHLLTGEQEEALWSYFCRK
jgi:hypothetical protein